MWESPIPCLRDKTGSVSTFPPSPGKCKKSKGRSLHWEDGIGRGLLRVLALREGIGCGKTSVECGCGYSWASFAPGGVSRRVGASGIWWDTRDGRPQVSPPSTDEGTRGALSGAFPWAPGSSGEGSSPGMRIPEGKGIPGVTLEEGMEPI